MVKSDVSIFILTSDRQYIEFGEYDRIQDGDGEFVSVTNDILNQEYGDDNTINISRYWRKLVGDTMVPDFFKTYKQNNGNIIYHSIIFVEYPVKKNSPKPDTYIQTIWQLEEIKGLSKSYKDKYEKQNNDVNGYQNTIDILTDVRKGCVLKEHPKLNEELLFPAFTLAHNARVVFNNKTLYGYLPAIGQLKIISDNQPCINRALKMIKKGAGIMMIGDTTRQTQWWSSTECDENQSWFLYSGSEHIGMKSGFERIVFPLFRI